MFGKKQQQQPPTPQAPWVVQVLTRDFLVEGFTKADDDVSSSFLEVIIGDDLKGSLLTLTQPNIQPAGAIAMGVPPGSKWVLPAETEFVAIIPGNDEALRYAVGHRGTSITPMGAVVLAAHYVIRGTILCPGGGGLEMLSDYELFAMQDSVIDYVGPGARLTNMDVPFMLVRTKQVQGIFVNA
jgi:hypothetical protein